MAYPWDNARDDRLKMLWSKGKTFAEIARDIDPDNLTAEMVRHRRRMLGLPPAGDPDESRWTPEVEAEFVRMWKADIRMKKIVETLDIPEGALRRRARTLGLPDRSQAAKFARPSGSERATQVRSFWTPERTAIIRENWPKPITLTEIAKLLDPENPPSKEMVRHKGKAMKLGERPDTGRNGWVWTEERSEIVRKLNAEGKHDPEIAKALGAPCTVPMVFNQRKKLGIKSLPRAAKPKAPTKPRPKTPVAAKPKVEKPPKAAPPPPAAKPGFRFGPQQQTASVSPKPPNLGMIESFELPTEGLSGVSIMEIGAHSGCRWPLGKIAAGDHHAFCGRPGYPYCDAHAARVYVESKVRREVDRRIRKGAPARS